MINKADMIKSRLQGLTYQQIGDEFHISKQRVHQIIKGYKSRRRPSHSPEYVRPVSIYPKSPQETRQLVLSHYGDGTLACVKCGFIDIRALSIDHINGKGGIDRHAHGTGVAFYRWLIKSNYPEGYQTLCRNCQQIKVVENSECLTRKEDIIQTLTDAEVHTLTNNLIELTGKQGRSIISIEQDLRDIKRAIPRALWLKARSQAIGQGRTGKAWLVEAIEEKLNHPQQTQR